MKNKPSYSRSAVLILGLIAFTGCGGAKDVDKVADAQSCLDTSTSNTALACLDKIDGVDTEAAHLIRCSAEFIYQQFTDPNRLAKISVQLQQAGSSASNATATALGLLSFTQTYGTQTASQLATYALNECTAAKSPGMTLLASMAQIATAVAAAGASNVVSQCDSSQPGFNASSCQTAVQTAVTCADPATVGNAALAAYQQGCSGAQSSSTVCQQYAAAVAAGNGNPSTIGSQLQSQIANGSTANCNP